MFFSAMCFVLSFSSCQMIPGSLLTPWGTYVQSGHHKDCAGLVKSSISQEPMSISHYFRQDFIDKPYSNPWTLTLHMFTLEDSAIFECACCKLSGFQRILKMRCWNVEHHGNWSLVFLVWKGKVRFQNSCREIPRSCCLWSPTAVEWTIKFKKALSFHRDSFLKSIESSFPLIVIGKYLGWGN